MRIKYSYYPGCCNTQVNLFSFFFSQGAVGPNGMLGWEEIQNLADALFQQRDSIDLIESCVDKRIDLWNKLPTAFQRVQSKLSSTLQGQHKAHWLLHAKETSCSTLADHHPRNSQLEKVRIIIKM